MKRADTFIKAKLNLKYDLIASIKEAYAAIVGLTGCAVIDLKKTYQHICDEIYIHIEPTIPYCGWGLITQVYRLGENMMVQVETPIDFESKGMYDLSVDELVDIYAELEKVYKHEKRLK